MRLLEKLGIYVITKGRILNGAFSSSQLSGLDDHTLALALEWSDKARRKYDDPAQRRAWVLAILEARGVKESIARLALELALQRRKSQRQFIGA